MTNKQLYNNYSEYYYNWQVIGIEFFQSLLGVYFYTMEWCIYFFGYLNNR
jgi:hypothetical protein